MSTRYVWDKHDIAYGNEQDFHISKYETLPSASFQAVNKFYFSTGIKKNADGTYTLTGTVISSTDMPAGTGGGNFVYADAWAYVYGAKEIAGNTSYLENTYYTESSGYRACWCFRVVSSGGGTYYGRVTLRDNSSSGGDAQHDFYEHRLSIVKGKKIGNVSSTSSDAYPNNGISGANWYTYKGSDSIDPLSVTYSTDKLERGEAVIVAVNPAANNLGGTVSYLYQYSINGGTSWTTVGTASTNTEKEIVVPENAEQFMARVRAQDDIGFTSNDYIAGSNLEVQTMRLWVGTDNTAKRGRKLWVGVNGVARPAVRGWVGDENGKARRWF